MRKRVPLPKALAVIVLSTLLISGGAYTILRLYHNWLAKRLSDPAYAISSITQATAEAEGLKTVYLAELMGLSKDRPISIYQFDTKEAEKRLNRSPLIKSSSVKRTGLSSLFVTYSMRQPIATLFDYENIAVDESGALFPIYPFFSPKRLPEIYLGLKPFNEEIYTSQDFFETPLSGQEFKLALTLLDLLDLAQKEHGFFLKRIDTSNSNHPSLGKREIDLLVENRDHSLHFLRLPTKGFEQQLANYLKLRESFSYDGTSATIDLRLPSLAYIDHLPVERQ